jgi:hypothetical protein
MMLPQAGIYELTTDSFDDRIVTDWGAKVRMEACR